MAKSAKQRCWDAMDELGADASVRVLAKRAQCHHSTAADAKRTYGEHKAEQRKEEARQAEFSALRAIPLWRADPAARGAMLALLGIADGLITNRDPSATPPAPDESMVVALDQIIYCEGVAEAFEALRDVIRQSIEAVPADHGEVSLGSTGEETA